MRVEVQIDGIEALKASLGAQARQIPYAARNAIYKTALSIKSGTLDEMRAKFDSPTPYTMRSMFIKTGKAPELSATVYLKDQGPGKNNAGVPDTEAGQAEQGSMAQIIGHQWSGGTRVRKRLEMALSDRGLIAASEFVVPGPDAKMDRYGNMSRGQVQQIYTAIRLHFDPTNNATQSKRSIRNARAASNMFWADGTGKLRRGVWGSDSNGRLKLILIAVPKVAYKKRIDMQPIADKIMASDWQPNFQAALAVELANAHR